MMRKGNWETLKGFSVVEILVTALIISFIVGAMFQLLDITDKAWRSDVGVVDLQQQCRNAMNSMIKEIREATNSSIAITAVDSSHDRVTFNTTTINGVQYYCDLSDANGDTITNQVIREYPSGTRKVLGNYITALRFTHTGRLLVIKVKGQKVNERNRTLCYPIDCSTSNYLVEEIWARN